MAFQQKTIKYKGLVVFEKITMPYFKRIPKLYQNNEACFILLMMANFLFVLLLISTPSQKARLFWQNVLITSLKPVIDKEKAVNTSN